MVIRSAFSLMVCDITFARLQILCAIADLNFTPWI
jgi:hypothetical protein